MKGVYILLILSVIGPLIGSLIGVLKKPSETFMHNLLAFAGGVMISISFLQLIPESIKLSSIYICVFGIIIGSLFMFSLDKIIPHIHPGLNKPEDSEKNKKIKRVAIYLLAGICLHNIPEGIAIGISLSSGFNLSLLIAIAITVHDIPEAICTSAPYFYSTGKRLKAFLLSSLTAVATIAGLLLSYFILNDISPLFMGIIIAATAGIMIYISGDELIPLSCNKENCSMKKGKFRHSAIFSLILGIIFVLLLGLIK